MYQVNLYNIEKTNKIIDVSKLPKLFLSSLDISRSRYTLINSNLVVVSDGSGPIKSSPGRARALNVGLGLGLAWIPKKILISCKAKMPEKQTQ